MNTMSMLRPNTGRCRQVAGVAMTILAALASMATSSSPEHTYVSVPNQSITLSQSAPQKRFRFRVETSTNRFTVEMALSMDAQVSPTLALASTTGGNGEVDTFQWMTLIDGVQNTNGQANVNIHCSTETPCTADFEVTCGAKSLTTDNAAGTLSVGVYLQGLNYSGMGETGYVAVQPL